MVESYDRVMVVEVMGCDAGWIVIYAGIVGGVIVILVLEVLFDFDEVCVILCWCYERGWYASIVVVFEGVWFREGIMEVLVFEIDCFGY